MKKSIKLVSIIAFTVIIWVNAFAKTPLPSSLDGDRYATPAKSQSGLGLCWLFADNAVLETYIKKTTGVEVNLSENHSLHGIFRSRFGITSKDIGSGNTSMSVTYWLRGELGGPVLTQDDYPYTGNPTNWNQNAPRYGRVTNVQWIPESELPELQNNTGYDTVFRNNIKEAINNYGSVAVSLYSNTSQLNRSPKGVSYYYNDPKSYSNTNHVIQILGWDDNYSAENFANQPPGDGAWYVKNSTTGGK